MSILFLMPIPCPKIHMKDSSVTGFIVLHAFVKLELVLGLPQNVERSSQFGMEIPLSAAILSTLIKNDHAPQQTIKPGINQLLDERTIQQSIAHWLNQFVDDIDNRIVNLEKTTIAEHV